VKGKRAFVLERNRGRRGRKKAKGEGKKEGRFP